MSANVVDPETGGGSSGAGPKEDTDRQRNAAEDLSSGPNGHQGAQEAPTQRSSATPTDAARLLRRSARRKERVPTAGGSTLHLLVLSSTTEDTTVVDLATRTVMRVRVPWPEGHEPDISTFDVVEVTLADDPERDDLAQPEATTVADLPRHIGTARGVTCANCCDGWSPVPTALFWASRAHRRPIGSSGASGRQWR